VATLLERWLPPIAVIAALIAAIALSYLVQRLQQ
jgi:hypothetical protein